jgi:DNA excision repair protein ERCC-4
MDKMIIVQDSREQLGYWKRNIITKKLNVGDYSFVGGEERVACERKHLGDLFGTLGKGHKRFKKEIERALDYDYFGIYIEGTREQIIKKDFPGSYHTKMRGYVIIKILDTIKEKYNVDVVYCNSRVGCKKAIKKQLLYYYNIYNTI